MLKGCFDFFLFGIPSCKFLAPPLTATKQDLEVEQQQQQTRQVRIQRLGGGCGSHGPLEPLQEFFEEERLEVEEDDKLVTSTSAPLTFIIDPQLKIASLLLKYCTCM